MSYKNEQKFHKHHEWEVYCSKEYNVFTLDKTGKGSGRRKWKQNVHR